MTAGSSVRAIPATNKDTAATRETTARTRSGAQTISPTHVYSTCCAQTKDRAASGAEDPQGTVQNL